MALGFRHPGKLLGGVLLLLLSTYMAWSVVASLRQDTITIEHKRGGRQWSQTASRDDFYYWWSAFLGAGVTAALGAGGVRLILKAR